METKHYITKIIGDGKTLETAWRSTAVIELEKAGIGAGVQQFIAVEPLRDEKGDIIPGKNRLARDWCLAYVESPDHTSLEASLDCDHIDPAKDKADIQSILVKYKIDTSIIDDATNHLEIIDALKQESTRDV